MDGRKKLTDEQAADMAKAWEAGEGTSSLARRYGVSATTVRRRVRESWWAARRQARQAAGGDRP